MSENEQPTKLSGVTAFSRDDVETHALSGVHPRSGGRVRLDRRSSGCGKLFVDHRLLDSSGTYVLNAPVHTRPGEEREIATVTHRLHSSELHLIGDLTVCGGTSSFPHLPRDAPRSEQTTRARARGYGARVTFRASCPAASSSASPSPSPSPVILILLADE
jgi:hypothetical protein